jgi:choline-sulfatase
MSDEHNPTMTGCYGHPFVRTPNMDRLAAGGRLFENAYANSPMCVPSRMSFLTGKYSNEIEVWDNGSPLRSEIPTFANYFEADGYDATLCGRMHLIGEDRYHGFGRRLYDDMEYWKSLAQKPPRTPEARRKSNAFVTECGPGDGSWQDYDSTVADLSRRFLKAQARYPNQKPWLLVSSFMFPHFPLIAPQAYFDMYWPDKVVMPDLNGETLESQHPAIQKLRYFFRNDLDLPEEITRRALASYYGLISLMDYHLGLLLEVVDQSPLKDNTVVIYVSDHGEMAGEHGIWQKQCFYESSVRIPLIIRTPQAQGGQRITRNVSLVDLVPTIFELADIEIPGGLAGQSLIGSPAETGNADDLVFSEYHAQGMVSGGFMLKKGNWKYIYYSGGHQPQLFNLEDDPGEFNDLAGAPAAQAVRQSLHSELLKLVDPEKVDARAKQNQKLEGMERAYKQTWPER